MKKPKGQYTMVHTKLLKQLHTDRVQFAQAIQVMAPLIDFVADDKNQDLAEIKIKAKELQTTMIKVLE